MTEWMRTHLNVNSLITTVVGLLVIWLITKVDENYNLLIVVKTNQVNVMNRLDKFEVRMTTLQNEISRIDGEVEILKKQSK